MLYLPKNVYLFYFFGKCKAFQKYYNNNITLLIIGKIHVKNMFVIINYKLLIATQNE